MLSKLSKVTELLLSTLPVSLHLLPWALPTITSMIPNSTAIQIPFNQAQVLAFSLMPLPLSQCPESSQILLVIPWQKLPKCFLPQSRPSCAHLQFQMKQAGTGLCKDNSFPNIFLKSPESHTTNSSLCIKYHPLLQPSFKIQNSWEE